MTNPHALWTLMGIAGAFPEFAAALDALIQERLEAGPNAPDDLITTMVQTKGVKSFTWSTIPKGSA